MDPESLPMPRQINPNISIRSEKAVLWAMSLHPDERPDSVAELRETLLGSWDPVQKPRIPKRPTLVNLLSEPVERALIWISVLLFLVSLAVTLMR